MFDILNLKRYCELNFLQTVPNKLNFSCTHKKDSLKYYNCLLNERYSFTEDQPYHLLVAIE